MESQIDAAAAVLEAYFGIVVTSIIRKYDFNNPLDMKVSDLLSAADAPSLNMGRYLRRGQGHDYYTPFGRPKEVEGRVVPCATFRRTMNPIGVPNPAQGEMYTIGADRYLPECWQVGAARFWAVADAFKGWSSFEGDGQRTAEKYWWDAKFRRIPTDAGVLKFDRHFREDVPVGGQLIQLPEADSEAARAALIAVRAIYQEPLDAARYADVFAVRFNVPGYGYESVRLFKASDTTPTGWQEVSAPYKAMGTLNIPITRVSTSPFDAKITAMWSYSDGDGDGRLADRKRGYSRD
jgi:hypothetical protein